MPGRTISNEERFIVVPGFRGFSPWSAGSIALSLKTRQVIMVVGAWPPPW
jgi:hypothetical protein